MKRLLRMFHTVRHVRLHQLFGRLVLTIRRKWAVRHADTYRKRLLDAELPALHVRPELPRPLFPPRTALATVEGATYHLTFLNEQRSFTHPFDWRPEDLKVGTRLWLLNLHYMEFLEALADDAFTAVLEDWMAHVPPYRPGYWLDDWNSYSLSIRCVVWMQQLAARPSLPESFRERVLESLYRQLTFLEANLEVDIGGNHLIKNIKALLWAGAIFDVPAAARWQKTGMTLLKREIDEQVLADGLHYERSPAYHCQVFADLCECYQVLPESNIRDELGEVLASMAQAVADLKHPDGLISLFNDGGLHMAYIPETCLNVWQQLSGDTVQPLTHVALKHSGYFGYRDSDSFVLVDSGKVAPDFLTAHGHGDILAFEWSVDGQRFIVDAGVFEYNPGSRRDYSRSTQAHNTLTLDNEDQCEFWGSFRIARRANVRLLDYTVHQDGFAVQGEHDGFQRLPGKPVHRRAFSCTADRITVQDEVKGGRGQQAIARLLLHPECTIHEKADGWYIQRDETIVKLTSTATVEVQDARWFPDFGVEESCKQLCLDYGSAPCDGTFTLERIEAMSSDGN